MTNQYLHNQTTDVLSSYGVKKAAIFGSHARGTQKKGSDIDILVELGESMSLLDFVGLKLDLEDIRDSNTRIKPIPTTTIL